KAGVFPARFRVVNPVCGESSALFVLYRKEMRSSALHVVACIRKNAEIPHPGLGPGHEKSLFPRNGNKLKAQRIHPGTIRSCVGGCGGAAGENAIFSKKMKTAVEFAVEPGLLRPRRARRDLAADRLENILKWFARGGEVF